MLGIKCKCPNSALQLAMRDQHLLGVPAGDNVVRLLPPLTITAEEARMGLEKIDAAAAIVSGNLAKQA